MRPVGLEPTPNRLKDGCSATRARDAQIFSAPATTFPMFIRWKEFVLRDQLLPVYRLLPTLVPPGGLEPPPGGVRIRYAAANTSEAFQFGDPTGTRTPVSGLKDQRPQPLDDGVSFVCL